MKDSLKIIHMVGGLPPYHLYANDPRPLINWDTPSGKWVGIWGYEWAHQIGNEVLKVSNNIIYEVWQPDLRADKVYKHTFENGLVHITFPSILESGEVYSEPILDLLNKESKNSKVKTLIAQVGDKHLMGSIILERFSSIYPIFNFFTSNLSFMDIKFGKNVLKWPKTLERWQEQAQHIKKLRYIGIAPFLPNEKRFKDKYIGPNQLLLHQNIGVDSSYFDSNYNSILIREKLGLPKDRKIYLSSSRLNIVKQLDKLIEVFSKLKSDKETLIITGAGTTSYRNHLKGLIKAQNNDIRLVDYLSEENLILHYKAADYFIDVSKNDGGPISAGKAIALGLPVITTATGNVGQFLKNNDCGCIIPVNNYKKWGEIFKKISLDELIVKAVSIEKVREFLSWENGSKKNIYNYFKVVNHFYGK